MMSCIQCRAKGRGINSCTLTTRPTPDAPVSLKSTPRTPTSPDDSQIPTGFAFLTKPQPAPLRRTNTAASPQRYFICIFSTWGRQSNFESLMRERSCSKTQNSCPQSRIVHYCGKALIPKFGSNRFFANFKAGSILR